MFLLFFLKLLIKSLTNASFFCDLGINVKNELHRIDSKKMSDTKKTPEHQAAYETLRNMILLGRFAPGQPLTIQGLADALNVGMTRHGKLSAASLQKMLSKRWAIVVLRCRFLINPHLKTYICFASKLSLS